MNYKGGRGVVPTAGVCPGKMIVKFRGWSRDMDMCRCFPLTQAFYVERVTPDRHALLALIQKKRPLKFRSL